MVVPVTVLQLFVARGTFLYVNICIKLFNFFTVQQYTIFRIYVKILSV